MRFLIVFNLIIKGVLIPEFTIESGKLIRLCLPNFDSNGGDLTGDFRYRLLNHFEIILPKSKHSNEHTEAEFSTLPNLLL
ncbi:hypothetical protein LY01_01795 [Nonlabens xylanidelens]|uniref:Uncharacterized protein n=1 Tax=Nonlabens xylanidelens TaxID=191564 RepID=A0A2S6ILD1_9FLAO|nr:hypothetical protein LY01_01795 [Nonlabens xylanidelens]